MSINVVIRTPPTGSSGISSIARAYFEAGRTEEALSSIDEALRVMESALDRYYEAELRRLKGEFSRKRKGATPEEAEGHFRTALAIAESQGSKALELRIAMSLGVLWAEQGKKAEAVALLEGIYGWFTEGMNMPDLVDARALLAAWRA